jgi:murein DD-endopeptidase MepM/ murein hydrolase activator NlpD
MYAHPTGGVGRYERGLQAGHTGTDISNPTETPIYAVMQGNVSQLANDPKGYGNYILLQHADQQTTLYAHLERFLVKQGDQVRRGQPIAIMGSTGLSTGRHLHFEYRKNGIIQDPNIILDNSLKDWELYDNMPNLPQPSFQNIFVFCLVLFLLYYLVKMIL